MKSKKELKEMENKELQKAAEKDEHTRLKVEKIESLEKSAKREKAIVILNAITSALFGLSAISYLMQALTTTPELFKQLPIYGNAFCSVVWGFIGRNNNKTRKEKVESVKEMKREVLGYSK